MKVNERKVLSRAIRAAATKIVAELTNYGAPEEWEWLQERIEEAMFDAITEVFDFDGDHEEVW